MAEQSTDLSLRLDQTEKLALEREIQELELNLRSTDDPIVQATIRQSILSLYARRDAVAKRITNHKVQAQDEKLAVFERFRADWRKEEIGEASYWLRRGHTSLAIGHGAAFVAVCAGAIHVDNPGLLTPWVMPATILFAVGMLASGLVPFLRATMHAVVGKGLETGLETPSPQAKSTRVASHLLTIVSAFVFVLGVAAVALALNDYIASAGTADSSQSPADTLGQPSV